ncbi:hypothetical protein HFU84_07100 [Acidithiobacillus sp. CV18-2]|uniref:Uncharacterized protein n=1 Tax=Igneacidithiobacillus copahuensis TaxID=2724909 RepID=A0AAE2YSL1_9PROT|nr:hypothetical protein [Acidithiobacillus sp. CV18-3]MBU2757456.1 hypothetical protein [Acidithiobacillus sp. BN09-2]MBU2777272.1 hypothetical protein [Acidithiobacillus sp. CV18-2]MBU2789165.1 hypothetical protein [Igneacidithiobacillus copahuensis]MBU2796245.1 hypothetical protein [Acidithiobacillus sp. VAN18-2]MBU2798446.1 hypothetical protein [Acidithiobacillus sp. VAN18-4]UTV82218.1 hypothetical protein MQE22_06270 [Acidithiobacillus sp. YTS05]
MHTSAKLGLASLFALSLGSLPLVADASTTAAPMNGQAQMSPNGAQRGEGNCSRMMGEGNCSRSMGEGNCSRSMGKMAESHCTSKAQIRAHDGKCGKAQMKKMESAK